MPRPTPCSLATSSRILCFAALISGLASAAAMAQAAPAAALTLERIMSDPDWIGNNPESPQWADDGQSVFFERKRDGESVRDLYQLSLAGGAPRLVGDGERSKFSFGDGDWSADRSKKAFVRAGDVFVHDLARREIVALTRTNEEESDAFFLIGDGAVAFRRGDDWFVRDLPAAGSPGSAVEWQAADLRIEKDPAEEPKEKTYLEEQEHRLFDVLRERERREKTARRTDEARQKADPARPRLPFYLGEGVEIETSALSPNGAWLLVVLGSKDESKRDQMPKWVTEDGLVDVVKLRPHVGAQVIKTPQVVLLDLVGHRRHDLDLTTLPGAKEDPLADLRKAADKARKEREEARAAAAKAEGETAGQVDSGDDEETGQEGDGDQRSGLEKKAELGKSTEAEKKSEVEKSIELAKKAERKGGRDKKPAPAAKAEEPQKPKDRALTVGDLSWSDDGTWAVFQAIAGDNKDRWILGVDTAAAKSAHLVPLERITDPAWINWSFQDVGWMPNARTLWYLSEQSGFSQLYLRPVSGAKRQLTHGEFEIRGQSDGSGPVPAHDGKSFVVVANQEHPGIWSPYRVSVETGALTRLSTIGGDNDVAVSPDESSLLLLHGSATRRPDLFVQTAVAEGVDAPARRLTDSASPEFAAIAWAEPEYVAIPATHAPRPIQARLYRQTGPGPHPAVLFIHGAGYLQNAHQGWSNYFREFMFHSLLVRQGYVVLDMDYRASAGYGRDWRTAIYRQMGTPELEDMQDGVRWLVAQHGVDAARIGVYGGSYGGFMTLMALFKDPDLFAAGAALRPVTDWAHYNHPYTANILNTPDVDPEAYQRSSPIEFAAGLRRPLLMCHGMVDDNVVFQDTVRLTQRLIELKKTGFETAIYPVEPHGFLEPTSWLDEYRRIFELFECHVRGSAAACSS